MNDLNVGIYHNLRQLINIVDQLRDVGLNKYINLPRIVVVGTQSAGKSSVLENIVGYDILPRGEGIVTRRPLELRLIHVPNKKFTAVFDEDLADEITDVDEIKRKISQYTDKLAGQNKGIIDVPIVLTITAEQCPDLTLVDLPGITRVPLNDSDQTDDIEKITRDMAYRYVSDPRSIILAVVPANQDMSTSDALHLAKKVDPNGLRTLGVITKIDLLDNGVSPDKVLVNNGITLRLGYIAVKNRSQKDIIDDIKINESIKNEQLFFENNKNFKDIPKSCLGTHNLINKLTKILLVQIKTYLPEIKQEILQRLNYIQDYFMNIGNDIPEDLSSRHQLIWTYVNDYCQVFSYVIKGKYDKRLSMYIDESLLKTCGGAQIRLVFSKLLLDEINNSPLYNLHDDDIEQALILYEGDNLPGFPSSSTFEYLILPYLKNLTLPIMQCLTEVSNTLELLLEYLTARILNRFPLLCKEILKAAISVLDEKKSNTEIVLKHYIECQIGYMFTNDMDYLSKHVNLYSNKQDTQDVTQEKNKSLFKSNKYFVNDELGTNRADQQASETMLNSSSNITYSSQLIQEIKNRLIAYYNITVENIRDTAPKIIGYFLVKSLQDNLQCIYYMTIKNQQYQDQFLTEAEEITEQRQRLKNQKNILERALYILQNDPKISQYLLESNLETNELTNRISIVNRSKTTNEINFSADSNNNQIYPEINVHNTKNEKIILDLDNKQTSTNEFRNNFLVSHSNNVKVDNEKVIGLNNKNEISFNAYTSHDNNKSMFKKNKYSDLF